MVDEKQIAALTITGRANVEAESLYLHELSSALDSVAGCFLDLTAVEWKAEPDTAQRLRHIAEMLTDCILVKVRRLHTALVMPAAFENDKG